ncbi:unnamed protein product [Choristocarpus tenellus]
MASERHWTRVDRAVLSWRERSETTAGACTRTIRHWQYASEEISFTTGRPSDFTLTKHVKIRKINAVNRTLNLDQLSTKLSEVGLVAGSSKLQRWVKVMGATKVKRRFTPSLSVTHQKNWVDFILDRAARNCINCRSDLTTIHIGEVWFYLVRKEERIRIFRGEERVWPPPRYSTRVTFLR